MSQKKPQQPLRPPDVPRKLSFQRKQLIGIPLMLLIPILAITGVFGESRNLVLASNANLEMQVEYPTRFRYKMLGTIMISLSNISPAGIPDLEVRIDRAYVSSFSTVTFSPSLKSITDEAYIVEVRDLQPGETRTIAVDVQAEEYGRHSGAIAAQPDNLEGIQVTLDTFVFP